jgi:alcohol dehydrogenase (cytochrome c)
MKTTLVFAALLLMGLPAYARAQVTGTWRAEARGTMWTAVLRQDGPGVIGVVTSCATLQGIGREISAGALNGNTVTFECASGSRRVTFNGQLKGDQIIFDWQLHAREGDFPIPDSDGIFGPSAPRRFVARRVPDSADALSAMVDRLRKRPTVTFDRIRRADSEPQNWLTYSGNVFGHRHSRLAQITPSNVKDLQMAWIWQSAAVPSGFQATPLVVDGVMYTVQAPNDVVALEATTGRVLWTYSHTPIPTARVAGNVANRGLAILGDRLFMGTLDAHLLAIDAYSGKLIWDIPVANPIDPSCQLGRCYGITHAPLIVSDKVIVGVAGGDDVRPSFGIRGFIAAFDVATGKEVWRFYTIPAPGEFGSTTWSGDSWKTGGAGVWVTGSYDPDLNMTYWGTGNPAPPRDNSSRGGDNLYSNSVVALDADTGALIWHYQFTPHDDMDWDSAQVPVLADILWRGDVRRVMLWANRNGVAYILDRRTGEFLSAKPFVEVNWMTGVDGKGRPIRVPGKTGKDKTLVLPGDATNWYPPSYSPRTGWFYIPAWERGAIGGSKVRGTPAYGAVRAFNMATGEKQWEFVRTDAVFTSGVLTTTADVLFTGVSGDNYSDRAAARLFDGYFYALDARSGEQLWQFALPGSISSGPITYSVDGKQYVAICAGNSLFSFALRP